MTSLGIWLVRPQALPLGQYLATTLNGCCYQPWDHPQTSPREQFQDAFHRHRRWVLIMASGIAARYLEGLARDKHQDPGIVVLDEAARFAIPLLCGHEGGANALAYQLARVTGATPAITTASEALKPLTLGIGCRQGKSAEDIHAAVRLALSARRLDEVREVVTIDLKCREPGILAFCKQWHLPLRVITTADLQTRQWVHNPSPWVQQNIGVAGVCEPCALIASPRGHLLVPKTALNGVTVAIVEDDSGLALHERGKLLI